MKDYYYFMFYSGRDNDLNGYINNKHKSLSIGKILKDEYDEKLESCIYKDGWMCFICSFKIDREKNNKGYYSYRVLLNGIDCGIHDFSILPNNVIESKIHVNGKESLIKNLFSQWRVVDLKLIKE